MNIFNKKSLIIFIKEKKNRLTMYLIECIFIHTLFIINCKDKLTCVFNPEIDLLRCKENENVTMVRYFIS